MELPQLQLIDKFGSRACRFAATGADGPDDDELWVFFKGLHTGAGPGVVSTGTWSP